MDNRKQVVILGGGFGGVYTALHLEKQLDRGDDVDIHLINHENYFVFQPMLAEIISGNIGIMDAVTPLARLLKRTQLHIRDVEEIDLERARREEERARAALAGDAGDTAFQEAHISLRKALIRLEVHRHGRS